MFPNPYTENDAENWFSIVASPSRSVHLAIEYEGEAVGGIGVIAGVDVNLYTGHFGYWVGESLWGKGIATASVKTFATYALSLSQFARLEARVYAWNPASMRVLEKVGFVREGVHERSIYKDGQIIDSVIYAKVR
jgi:RimJ/RimL family protein N-acetyltransferase